jgi:hypothetical protein
MLYRCFVDAVEMPRDAPQAFEMLGDALNLLADAFNLP